MAEVPEFAYRGDVVDVTAPSRRERRMAETRTALVTAAQELFRRQGFEDTTVDQIAERADVAPRTFFRYFPSKDAVLFADFEELHRALVAAVAARPVDEAPVVALHRALHDYLVAVQSRFKALAAVVRMAEETPGGGLERAAMRQRLADQLTATVAARMGVDPRIDPRPGAWVGVLLSCVGAAIRTSVFDGGEPAARFDRLIAETSDALAAALHTAPPARRGGQARRSPAP